MVWNGSAERFRTSDGIAELVTYDFLGLIDMEERRNRQRVMTQLQDAPQSPDC
jgi:hypothetical protein